MKRLGVSPVDMPKAWHPAEEVRGALVTNFRPTRYVERSSFLYRVGVIYPEISLKMMTGEVFVGVQRPHAHEGHRFGICAFVGTPRR